MAWNHRQKDLPTELTYLKKLQEKLDANRYFTILRRVEAWSQADQNLSRELQLKDQIAQIISWLEDDLESIRELNCILPPGIALLVPPRSVLEKDATKCYGTLLTEQGGEILSLELSPDTGGFHVIFDSDDLLTVQGNNNDWAHCVEVSIKEGWGVCLTDLLSREFDDPSNPEATRQLAFRRQLEMLEQHEYFPTQLLLHDVTRTGKRPETAPCALTFAERYRGEMGEGRAVCLKIFQKPKMRDSDWSKDNQFKQRVFREILPWCRLRHRNILPFLGVNKFSTSSLVTPNEKGRWTLVVPWIKRKDILAYVSENKPDMKFRRNAVCDIIQGLMYLHEQTPPIFHGDLKAAHVLVDEDGTCLLINFDTYRLTRDHAASSSMAEYSSEKWQAPEVLAGGTIALADKAAADVYALGCVMLEIYSGKVPQFADKDSDIKNQVVEKDRRPDVPSGVPEEIVVTIDSCWAREPSDRPKITDLASEYTADRSNLSGESTIDVHQRWAWKPQPENLSKWVAEEVSTLCKGGAQMEEDLPKIMYLGVDSMSHNYHHSSTRPNRPAGFLRALDEAYKQAEAQGEAA